MCSSKLEPGCTREGVHVEDDTCWSFGVFVSPHGAAATEVAWLRAVQLGGMEVETTIKRRSFWLMAELPGGDHTTMRL